MSFSQGYSDPLPIEDIPAESDPRDNDQRLWIGNLDLRITEFMLLKILQKYGRLKKFDFLYNKSGPDQGKPRGYCFITYSTAQEAEAAQKRLNGKMALSKKLVVRPAHVPKKSVSEVKRREIPPESKIKEIEAKLKQMENSKDDFSIEQPSNLPVVVKTKHKTAPYKRGTPR